MPPQSLLSVMPPRLGSITTTPELPPRVGVPTAVTPFQPPVAPGCTDTSQKSAAVESASKQSHAVLSVYPGATGGWNGVTAIGTPTLGGNSGVVVIDPKRGGITDSSDWGGIALQAPEGSEDYRLNFYVDTRGRAMVCEPADAPDKMPGFTQRRCSL